MICMDVSAVVGRLCCDKNEHYVCDDKECQEALLGQAQQHSFDLSCKVMGIECTGLFPKNELRELAEKLGTPVNEEETDVTPPPATLEQEFYSVLTCGRTVMCPGCQAFTQKNDACMHMHCDNCRTSFCFCCGRPSGTAPGSCPTGTEQGGCDATNCYLENNPGFGRDQLWHEVQMNGFGRGQPPMNGFGRGQPPMNGLDRGQPNEQASSGNIALEKFYLKRTLWFLKIFYLSLRTTSEIIQFERLVTTIDIQGKCYTTVEILEAKSPLFGQTKECEIELPMETLKVGYATGAVLTRFNEWLEIHASCMTNAHRFATIIQNHWRSTAVRNRNDYLQHHASDWNPPCSTKFCKAPRSINPHTLEFYETCCRSCCNVWSTELNTSCEPPRPTCTTSGCNRPRAPKRRSKEFHPTCSLTCTESLPGGKLAYEAYRKWISDLRSQG